MPRLLPYLSLFLLLPGICTAQNSVTVPWEEFKNLYREQVENALKQQTAKPEPAPMSTIEEALYQLVLSDSGVTGRISLRGQVLRGEPEPLLLFDNEIAITGIDETQGGALFSDAEGYKFFTRGGEPFQLTVQVAVPVQEDQRSRFIAFRIPQAVQNALKLALPSQLRLLEAPGLRHGDGQYYFAPGEELRLRFTAHDRGVIDAAPVVDTFTRIELAGNKYDLSAAFAPARPVTAPLRVDLRGARYLESSLKPSWVRQTENGTLLIDLPRGWQAPFTLRYEQDASVTEAALPGIADNLGREGEFQIREPVEARITPSAEGLQRNIPISRLPRGLREFAEARGAYARVPDTGVLTLALERFAAVSAPEIVLDTIHFYVSFTQNGNALSVLRLELPPEAGQKLKLKPIPGAEIWSLTVNDTPRSLYSQGQGDWIVPLAGDTTSVVELAYLQKGDKLGLKGRLALTMPATGLAARRVNVSIALAERVELVALEGDVEPAKGKDWPKVNGFAGRPYFFTRPFYRGEALEAAIYYKEPVVNRSDKS